MPPFCAEHDRHHVDRYECGEMRRAEALAARDAARREHAERIAAATLDQFGMDPREDDEDTRRTRRLAAAAALQALTEKENAR